MTPLKTRMLTRQQIGAFIASERGVRAFEGVQEDIGNQYEALTTASFLTVSSEPSTGSERVFTPSGDFSVTDNGPNSPYVFALSDTGILAGTYGDAAHTLGVTVSATGRISAVTEYELDTDNITEGSTNLFFTTARARASVSGGGGLVYDSGTGVFDVGAGTGITVNADDVALSNTAVMPGTYGSSSSIPTITVDQQGRITAASGNPVPAIVSGTYTPTLTNVANLDSSTAYACQYLRVGYSVTVSGRVDINPTLAATTTQLGISLPVASDFASSNECGGTAAASGIAGQVAAIRADAANNRAELVFTAGDVTDQPMYFSFTYTVI